MIPLSSLRTSPRPPAQAKARRNLMWLLGACALFLGSLLPATASAQTGEKDQSVTGTNVSYNGNSANLTWQQEVHVGKTGVLEGIVLSVDGTVGQQFAVRVRKGSVWNTGTILFDGFATKGNGNTAFVDMSASQINLSVNDKFVFELKGLGQSISFNGPSNSNYAGPLYLNASPYVAGYRIAFESYMQTCKDGESCDDGDLCTTFDKCVGTTCKGQPVMCQALDQCHVAGTCDPKTGMCDNPLEMDGVACDDGDACSQSDTCQAGNCTGDDPVVCTAMDVCHEVGTCDPKTGVCDNPNAPDDTSCDDDDACSKTDSCQAGICTGADLVMCTALDQCHLAGSCDPKTGMCDDPLAPDGTTCDEGLCAEGTCVDDGEGGSDGSGGSGGSASTGGSGGSGGAAPPANNDSSVSASCSLGAVQSTEKDGWWLIALALCTGLARRRRRARLDRAD